MMVERPPLDVRLEDRLTLAKTHPCGSRTWRVVRVGADIGLVCDGCGHRILLERSALEQRIVEMERDGHKVDR